MAAHRTCYLPIIALALLTSTHAAEPPPPPDPAAHSVLIPFDQTKPLKDQKPQRYYLDRTDFDRLWSLAKENRKPEKLIDTEDAAPTATLHSALYRASLEDERFVVEAQFEVTTRGHWAKTNLTVKDSPANASLPLRGLVVDGKPGAVTGNEITFEQPGHHVVLATYEVAQKRHWRQVHLSLPAARAAMASIKLRDTDAIPAFADSKLVAVEETSGTTRTVTVGLGSATALHFNRVQRRPVSDAPPPSADVAITTSLTGEMRLHGVVQAHFAFPGASRKEVSLVMDPDWSLDAAPNVTSGKQAVRDVRIGLLNEAGKQRLIATFPHEVSDEVTLDFHLTPNTLTAAHTPFIAPKAAKWESIARLIAQDGVQLIAQPTATQQRLANEDYRYNNQTIPVTRYRLGNTDTLAIATQPADAKTSARIDYVYQLSEQKQELAAAITLMRARGAWRQLRIGLPAGMEIQSVQGPELAGWELQGSELFLRFNDNTANVAKVIVYVANTVLQAAKTWTLEPLKLTDIQKVKGSAIVAAHAATEARLDGFKPDHDLREIDPATLTSTFTITRPLEKKRAIEFERAAWTLNVTLQDLPTRFSADGILLAQATDLGVLVSQQLGIIVEQGALKRLIVRLPKSLPEATVTGDQLREVQPRIVGEMREYECTFQSQGGLLGSTALTFDMQLPLTDAELPIPFVEIADAERLRRYFVLDNSSSRESKTLQADGADLCAKDALPYLPKMLTQPQFYQGRASGGLKVAFTQLQATSGNAAIVTLADITTVLRADGERWDTVVYSLSNRSLQFLPVILPDKAELIAVSVSGEAVRADEEPRNGQRVRLIPLIQTRPGERSMEVKLVYRIKGSAFTKHVKLDDPELVGLNAERTVWTASLPKGWSLDDTTRDTYGNMEPIAEEGREIEKLQSWMSDLSRINRVVSSSKDVNFNEAAIAQADQLNKQIEEVTKKVESRYNGRYGDDNSQRFQGELTKFKEEQGKQVLVLTENRIAQPIFSQRKVVQGQALANGWGDNPSKVSNVKQELAQPQKAAVGLNDNVAVNQDFYTIDLNLTPEVREFEGFINYGKPLNLSAGNTYTGATTINAGTLTTTAADALGNPTTVQLTSNSIPQPVFDTRNAFGGNSNARAYNNTVTLNSSVQSNASPPLEGAATITKSGAATLTLNGSMTPAGNVDPFGNTTAAATTGSLGNLTVGVSTTSPTTRTDVFGAAPQNGAGLSFDKAMVVSDNVDGLTSVAPKPQNTGKDVFTPFKTEGELIKDEGRTTRAPVAKGKAPALALALSGAADMPTTPAQIAKANAFKAGRDDALRTNGDSSRLVTQAVNQLRPTGRRSLQVTVPVTGETFHFRKLKDHAVLDLSLKHDWQEGKTTQATLFGLGLGVWGLLAVFSARRRKACQWDINPGCDTRNRCQR